MYHHHYYYHGIDIVEVAAGEIVIAIGMKYLMIVLVAVADDTRGLLENVNWSPDEEVRSQMRWWVAVAVIVLPRREKQSLRGVYARGVGSVRTVVVDVVVDSRIACQSQCQLAGMTE